MYVIPIAESVTSNQDTSPSPLPGAGGANNAKVHPRCVFIAQTLAGDQIATVKYQGRATSTGTWITVGTHSLSAPASAKESDEFVFPFVRANITFIGIGVTVDAWLIVYDQ